MTNIIDLEALFLDKQIKNGYLPHPIISIGIAGEHDCKDADLEIEATAGIDYNEIILSPLIAGRLADRVMEEMEKDDE